MKTSESGTRIVRVEMYGYDVNYVQGTFVLSGGREITTLPSTVVRVITDSGAEGFGETCPLGPAYLPAFGEGARAAIAVMGPAAIGGDVANHAGLGARLDHALKGHGYAKAAIDIACWDALGHRTGLSVASLLGGITQPRFPLYHAISLGSTEDMARDAAVLRHQGIHHYQLKLGDDPRVDVERVNAVAEQIHPGDTIVADANCGWRLQDAVIAARLLEGLDHVLYEQPCPTMEECRLVRQRTTLPMVLDEVIVDVAALLRAHELDLMEQINLKISRVGGLTKAKQIRDLCETLGIRMMIEDSWGGDVTSAAVAHLSGSTDPDSFFAASFMNDWVLERVAGHHPRADGGFGSVPDGPGLGITVDVSLLGAPLAVFE